MKAYHFREREAQLYLSPGEMRRLLSPIDRAVLEALTGGPITGVGIRKKTGLSRMACLLAGYRLVGLGLITQRTKRRRK